jgi:hypothetical protein
MPARFIAFLLGVAVAVPATVLLGQGAQTLPDAIKADNKTYSVEFENDIVRVLRVRLAPGVSTPRHAHAAYCAVEITDSSLREPNGPVSESKAGQVFCGDALAHAPSNVGKALAESVVVEFKGRQKAR